MTSVKDTYEDFEDWLEAAMDEAQDAGITVSTRSLEAAWDAGKWPEEAIGDLLDAKNDRLDDSDW